MTEAIAKNAPRQRRAMRGYTLMEFMMALGILALLVSLAVPSIQSGFAKQHLRAATVEVMDVFGYARVQAMARNRAYEVRITGQGSPSGKLAVHESINTRCSGMTGGLQNLKVLDLSIGDYDDIRIVGSEPSGLGAGSFGLCFLPNGRVVQSDTLLPVETTVDDSSEVLIVAEALLDSVKGDKKILKKMLGRDLERVTYTRPFDYVEIPDAHYVVLATYVTTEDGPGLVHQSPAFGADDLAICRAYGLPVVNPIAPDGTFLPELPVVGGSFFKDADKALVKELAKSGALYKHQPYEHSYPHCWRCHTALMYYAQPSWYIRTTSIKDALLRENAATDWHPETIKDGRYGDWLNTNIDWALSRNRYWGTPLPIWRCENKHEICVDSLKELGELAGKDLSNLDPHRPYVDDIELTCNECASVMRRVPEVIDCWYDSGAMPFAQWGYPHKEGSLEKFEAAYPADFICEAIDQTRGWFYTLMTIGTLVFDKSSYKTVLCLGHILDKDGRKMSKHLGNVLEPMALMDQHGADAVRWFMLAAGSPWAARRVGHDAINEVGRKTLHT